MTDFINITGCNVLSECCWCEGNTKGIHIYVKIKNLPSYTNQVDVFKMLLVIYSVKIMYGRKWGRR